MTAERPPAPGWRSTLRSPLARRLVLAFVSVAVAAVFVLAGLTLWRTKHTVGRLADDRRQDTAEAIARTLALGYQETGSWARTDSHPATMLAIQAGAALQVIDPNGNPIRLPSSMGAMAPRAAVQTSGPGITRRAQIMVNGVPVGTASVSFTNGELAIAEQHVSDALRGTVALGALIAALVALVVAVPLAQRVVAPLSRITDTARRLGHGDHSARVEHHSATGELGILAATFDDMAERLDAHETIRRNLTADLAHELRTPLTLLQGSCEELIDGISPPGMARFVELHDDILRMRRLVDDLATLADADAATTEGPGHHQRVDLATLATTVAERLRPLAENSQQQLDVATEPVHVLGDPIRLAQIMTPFSITCPVVFGMMPQTTLPDS